VSVDVEVNVKDLDDSEESVVAFDVKEVEAADSDLDAIDDVAAVVLVDDDDGCCCSLKLLLFLSNIEYSSADIFLSLLLTVSCIKLELMLPVMLVMAALEEASSCSCLAEEVRT